MPRTLNIKDNDTGANARVTWYGSEDPTDDDLKQIFEEQHKRSREAVDKVANAPLKLSPIQKLGQIKFPGGDATVGDAVQAITDNVIKPIESSPYLPNLHNLTRATEGVKRLVTGKGLDNASVRDVVDPSIDPDYYRQRAQLAQNPPRNPRTLGAEEAITGGLGLAAVALPSSAISAPIETLARLGAGYGASKLTQKVLPKSLAPEQRDLASTVAGILAGSAPKIEISRSPAEDVSPGPLAPKVEPPSSSGPSVKPPQDTAPIALPPAGTHALESGLPSGTETKLHPAIENTIPKDVQTPYTELHPAIDKVLNDETDFKPSEPVQAVEPQPKAPKAPSPIPAPAVPILAKPAKPLAPPPTEPLSRAPQDTETELHPAISKVLEEPQDQEDKPNNTTTSPQSNDVIKPKQQKVAKPRVTYKKVDIPTASSQIIADAKDYEPLKLDKIKDEPVPEPKVKTAKEEQSDAADRYLDHLDMLADHPDQHDTILPQVSQLAQQVRIKPSDLEADLRSSNVPEDKIDQIIKQTYPDVFDAETEQDEDDSERGSFSLTKKNQWKPQKARATMKVPTGLVAKGAHAVHGWVRSTDQFLSKNPTLKPMVDDIKASHFGEGGEENWKYQIYKKFAEDSKSFKGDWKELRDYLDGKDSVDPEVKRVGTKWRSVLDHIYNESVNRGVTNKTGKPVNYLSDYISHISKDDTFGQVISDSFKHIFGDKSPNLKERLFGSEDKEVKPGYGVEGQSGPPKSPFTETRKGPGHLLEDDPRIIIRRYVDSMARVMFRKPVYQKNLKLLDKTPDSFDKKLATWYNKQYAGIPTDDLLGQSLKQLDSAVAKIGARSYLAGSVKLQILHAARLVAQGWPEVGTEYSIRGLAETLKDIKGSIARTTRSGLLPQSQVPGMFKTKDERFNNLINMVDVGNTFAKTILLNANRLRLKDKGVQDYEQQAIYETARQEGFVNPTSPVPILDRTSKAILQFQHYKQKYGENVAEAAMKTFFEKDKESAMRLGRYILAAAGLLYITKKTGVAVYHIAGKNLLDIDPIVLQKLKQLGTNLSKGEFFNAAFDLGQYLTPGGSAFTKRDSSGIHFKAPSLFESPKESTGRGRRVVRRRPR